jgi:tetratricopeptide (TPR) repeat protein
MPDAPADQNVRAQVYRGVTCGQLGEAEKAIADCSAVVEMPDAPADQKARALVYRGFTCSQLGEAEKAIADYSAVVEMADAPADQKAWALINRGIVYGRLGEAEKAIADYSAVIAMADAPADKKARALVSRGFVYGRLGEAEKAIADCSAAVGMADVPSAVRTFALFCIPEAMIPLKPISESLASLQRAFAEGDSKATEFGGSPGDILKMVLRREPSSWSEYVEKLVAVYAEYSRLTLLGSGLTELIEVLDQGYSESQLDLWNSAWQKFGSGHDELSIPLAALDAAVQVIKSGSDRPLFGLPLEIRKIVRPLLNKSLSEE